MTKNTTHPLRWMPAFLMGCTLALVVIPNGCQFTPATEPQTEHPRWVCHTEPAPWEPPNTPSEPTNQPDAATPPKPPRPEPIVKNDTPPDTTPTPPEQIALSPIEQCLQLPSGPKTIKCLEPHIHTEVSTKSAKDVVCMLQRLVKEGKIDDCHLLAHIVGEAQLKKSQGDVGKAIGSCPDGCIQGCIHGVIESSFGSLQRDNVDSTKLLATCDKLKHDDVSYRQCIHGLGHGLLSHGIFSIQEAVALCQSHQDAYFQFNCLIGVMMEQFDRYMYLPETAFKKVLPGICDPIQSMGQSVFAMCIDSVGEGLMFYTGHNLPLAQQLCEQLSHYRPADMSRCKAAAKAQKEAQDAGRQAPLCE